jgi:hypothetical protein
MNGDVTPIISTNRSPNLAPFNKLCKSGDGGRSGDVIAISVRAEGVRTPSTFKSLWHHN